ncbi:hypothetical protein BH708_05195 [Brachybacterium sp. P6-10-X1]|uniref:hypothetical protein n=1 Tax=Brachybacterium sp. P6-10-X1 TaxID=1903186 RepID=UPI0009717E17|nr:hypothetical protein [Brachybacterium sp. P6-10-X1]APX32219.1 hypothetical protein BH708_05195 [Brachybacterium sp. P6-10-X1]
MSTPVISDRPATEADADRDGHRFERREPDGRRKGRRSLVLEIEDQRTGASRDRGGPDRPRCGPPHAGSGRERDRCGATPDRLEADPAHLVEIPNERTAALRGLE